MVITGRGAGIARGGGGRRAATEVYEGGGGGMPKPSVTGWSGSVAGLELAGGRGNYDVIGEDRNALLTLCICGQGLLCLWAWSLLLWLLLLLAACLHDPIEHLEQLVSGAHKGHRLQPTHSMSTVFSMYTCTHSFLFGLEGVQSELGGALLLDHHGKDAGVGRVMADELHPLHRNTQHHTLREDSRHTGTHTFQLFE